MGNSFKQFFRQRTLIGVLFLTFRQSVAARLVLGLIFSLLTGCAAIKNAATYDGDDSVSENQKAAEKMNLLGAWEEGGRGF